MNVIERRGAFLFHDVNLRLSASVGAAIGAGLDVPRLGVEAAAGRLERIDAPPPRAVT
jgi:hypothetical protein